ncbi:YesL family protein [Neobacillus dielmonensis]|uniref:YesL family protein n=1 Tax=Neobacillus dielmonensis TaxID=1347369 RepID=UPI0005A7F607|nr:YesL family protein [Neobacillus dielmonensis]
MGNFAAGYYRFCTWMMKLVSLNLLWIGFSIAGLLVLGAFPSTIAMFAVVRKWITGERDVPIFQTFWKSFKKEFMKGNILGYLLFAIGYILYIDLQYVRLQEGLLFQFLSYAILGLFFIYFIIVLYVFPLFVHFETKILHYLKWSLIIGISHPIITCLMAAGLAAEYFIVKNLMPGLILFILGSGSSYVLMWCAYRTFSAYSGDTYQTLSK